MPRCHNGPCKPLLCWLRKGNRGRSHATRRCCRMAAGWSARSAATVGLRVTDRLLVTCLPYLRDTLDPLLGHCSGRRRVPGCCPDERPCRGRFICLRFRCLTSRQDVAGHLPGDYGATLGAEDTDQADLFLSASHRIPRQPEAVRVAKFRFAVVAGELFRGKHELAIRCTVFRCALLVLKSIDDQFAIDLDGLVFRIVKIHSAAQSARGRAVRLVDHRIGPKADDLVRVDLFAGVVGVPDPGDLLGPGFRNDRCHFRRSAAHRRKHDKWQ